MTLQGRARVGRVPGSARGPIRPRRWLDIFSLTAEDVAPVDLRVSLLAATLIGFGLDVLGNRVGR